MAYSVRGLNRLGDEMMEESESSGSSISLSSSKSSRNELSEALEKIRLSKETLSESDSKRRTESSKTKTDSDVKLQRRVVNLIKRETERASTNIVMHVKYYSSPLRLILKTKFLTLSPDEKIRYASTLKMSAFVKNDLISEWNAKDFFGLKVLVKMYRLYKMVFPMLGTHEQFMEHFKPGDIGNEPHKDTIYYLFNYVMNPGVGHYSPTSAVPLEHEVHQWLTGFLADRVQLIEEVGFDLVDYQKEFIKKLAFEMNVLASTLFKKPISFKYYVSEKNIHKESMSAEQVMMDLYKMYESFSALNIVAQQMMFWMNQDDSMQGQPRAILGGGDKKKALQNKK